MSEQKNSSLSEQLANLNKRIDEVELALELANKQGVSAMEGVPAMETETSITNPNLSTNKSSEGIPAMETETNITRVLPDLSLDGEQNISRQQDRGSRFYTEYEQWYEYTNWSYVNQFNLPKFIQTIIKKLCFEDFVPTKIYKKKQKSKINQNDLVTIAANTSAIWRHFNKGFGYFVPRLYVKSVIASREHYRITFWCTNRGESRKVSRKHECLCDFSVAFNLPKDFKISNDSLDELLDVNKLERIKFPQICEKQQKPGNEGESEDESTDESEVEGEDADESEEE